ncbi:S-layer homology domain-containing protein [Lachnoclostridium phytofermentans]|uniref:S-layer domain protein n=1 Tax=Lachnoclostridium phytofermentans (strain ATCC 700394 / DSM 18823 / ISDg) TaxID=357809 RepID=A9KSB3_LACP7|nr:S-layer homology domain-containing protein [Lachnoclostridium phytofermentans]ABX42145.1 S-layer domain protein [Lachnoclostridium phytofermentans ISDg]
MLRNRKKEKSIISILIIIGMIFSMVPAPVHAKDFTDTKKHPAKSVISKWSDYGVIPDQKSKFYPDTEITLEDAALFLARLMGYQSKVASSSIKDISKSSQKTAVLKAVYAGIITPKDGYINPKGKLSRQDLAILLGKAFALPASTEKLTFKDTSTISKEALPYVKSAIKNGIMKPYADNTFHPKKAVTRAEFITMIDSIVIKYFNEDGTYSKSVTGTAVINTGNITLKKMQINGNLIIAEGVGSGDVTLDNVEISGQLIVRGGGKNSIHIIGSTKVANIIVDKKEKAPVSLKFSSSYESSSVTVINGELYLYGNMKSLDVKTSKAIHLFNTCMTNLIVTENGSPITIDASSSIKALQVKANDRKINISGEVDRIVVSGNTSDKSNPVITIKNGARINQITLNKKATINNEGSINNLLVNVNNVTVKGSKPNNVTINKKVTIPPVFSDTQTDSTDKDHSSDSGSSSGNENPSDNGNSSGNGNPPDNGNQDNDAPLTVPQNVVVRSESKGNLITWNSVQGATGYNIYKVNSRFSDISSGTCINGATPVTKLSYTDNGKSSDYYIVIAINKKYESNPSDPMSAEKYLFGPNVYIYSPDDDSAKIQAEMDRIFALQEGPAAQFGEGRYAILFKPGTYQDIIPHIGFYTQVSGLGKTPLDTNLSSLLVDAKWLKDSNGNNNATCNFWRSVENINFAGNSQWAVAQAAPMRRINIEGNLRLDDGGWASGGYIADSKISGTISAGGQQQWISRNTYMGNWSGGQWNMVFVGDTGTIPSGQIGSTAGNVTVVAEAPIVSEKPFLYLDSDEYKIFVPSIRKDASGTSWSDGNIGSGTSISVSDCFIAKPSDTADMINAGLTGKKGLIFTPGIYYLNKSINITQENFVVLGLGLATLVPTNANIAIDVSDVPGVKISGIIFDAGSGCSDSMLRIGASKNTNDNSANPIVLSDLFFRVGGDLIGKVNKCIEINSNNVIGDHFWIWRADHGKEVAWDKNVAKNGLVVNGDNVTVYGLFCEHFQEYETLWNGDYGKMFFYQNELPYDVPYQSDWMSKDGTVNGYAAYKVADQVEHHEAWGLGVYDVFIHTLGYVDLHSAIEVPDKDGVKIHNACIVSLGTNDIEKSAGGGISHVVNEAGGGVGHQGATTGGGQYAEGFRQNVAEYCNPLPTPIISVPTGRYDTMQTVSIVCSGADIIKYTLDGSMPSATNGTLYTGPFLIGDSTKSLKLTAVGFKQDKISLSASVIIAVSDDIALFKPTRASSVNGSNYAYNVNDGLTMASNHRWESKQNTSTRYDDQWIEIDLEEIYSISKVELSWYSASSCGFDYKIQISDDRINWTDIQTITGNTATNNNFTYGTAQPSGRYIRVYGTQKNGMYGYSMGAFKVYGKPYVEGKIDPFTIEIAAPRIGQSPATLSPVENSQMTFGEISWSGVAGATFATGDSPVATVIATAKAGNTFDAVNWMDSLNTILITVAEAKEISFVRNPDGTMLTITVSYLMLTEDTPQSVSSVVHSSYATNTELTIQLTGTKEIITGDAINIYTTATGGTPIASFTLIPGNGNIQIVNLPVEPSGNIYATYYHNGSEQSPRVLASGYHPLVKGGIGSGTSQTVGAIIKLSDTPNGGISGLTYQWQKSLDGFSNWEDIPGATADSGFTATNDLAGYFTRRVTFADGITAKGMAASVPGGQIQAMKIAQADLTGYGLAAPTAGNTAPTACSGSSIKFSVDSIEWRGLDSEGKYQDNSIAVARITLSAAAGYTFSNLTASNIAATFTAGSPKIYIIDLPSQFGGNLVFEAVYKLGTPASYSVTVPNSITTNGVVATVTLAQGLNAGIYYVGEPVIATVALNGPATLSGKHTVEITGTFFSVTPLGTYSTTTNGPVSSTSFDTSNFLPAGTNPNGNIKFLYEFDMPSTGIAAGDLTLTHTFSPATNIALKAPAKASSISATNTANTADKAVDGVKASTLGNRWESVNTSDASAPQWIVIDLGDEYNISDLAIYWNSMASRGRFYTIDVCNDLDWNLEGEDLMNSGSWMNAWTVSPNGWNGSSSITSASLLNILSSNSVGGEYNCVATASATPTYGPSNTQGVLGSIRGPKFGTGRYIRMYGCVRGDYTTTSGFSIWEVEVYGTKVN